MVLFVFGSLTIVSGGRALFTEAGISSRGNIVPLVLWFNFVSGFFYLAVVVSIFKFETYFKRLSIALAVLNSIVLLYLLIHISLGGLFESRTLFAMCFRAAFWIAFVALVFRYPEKRQLNS